VLVPHPPGKVRFDAFQIYQNRAGPDSTRSEYSRKSIGPARRINNRRLICGFCFFPFNIQVFRSRPV